MRNIFSHMPINRLYHLGPRSRPKTRPAIVLANCRVFFDFDNTLTKTDVLDDILKTFSINDQWMALEKAWIDGAIGTKECLVGQLKGVRVTKKELCRYLANVGLDPYCYKIFSFLKKEGVPPVILSDNFSPIVEEILKHQAIDGVKVYGNALRFYKDRIIPSFPYDNPFCPSCAHCKKIHLSRDKNEDKLIVYVGDGRSDFCPAQVSDVVFAKDGLAEHLSEEGKDFIPYKDLGAVHDYFKEAAYAGPGTGE